MSRISPKEFTAGNGLIVTIRNAGPGDASDIIRINLSVIDENLYMMRGPGEASYSEEGETNRILAQLENQGSLFIVSEVNGRAVGYLDFQNGMFRRTRHAGLFSIFILKKFRGIGIGKKLLDTLLDWAEKNPVIEKVTLAVFSTNERAISLYRNAGFEMEGNCPRDMKFEDGSYADSYLMYKFVK